MLKSPKTLKSIAVNKQFSFTLKPAKYVKPALSLCDHCACNESFDNFAECEVDRESMSRLQDMGVMQEITHCTMYQPVISFQAPLIGFEDEFNTIRPGVAWYARLRYGNTVGLLDVVVDELFGKAKVIDIDKGNISDMLSMYAANNHLMLSHTEDQEAKLMSVLTRIYGPRIINGDSNVSVITLKRL